MKRTLLLAAVAALTLGWLHGLDPVRAFETNGTEQRRIRNGDTNGDCRIDVSDALRLLNFLFLGDDPPVEITEEETLSEELLAEVLDNIARVLEAMPTPEQIAVLPRRLGGYFVHLRKHLRQAQMTAVSWDHSDLERFATSLQAMSWSAPLVMERVAEVYPEVRIDVGCLVECEARFNVCEAACGSPTGINYIPCILECTSERLECTLKCGVWAALLN